MQKHVSSIQVIGLSRKKKNQNEEGFPYSSFHTIDWLVRRKRAGAEQKIGQGVKDMKNLGYLKENYLEIMTQQQWDSGRRDNG